MGPYFGIREGGSLICAGGVHLVSERYRIAAIGLNVMASNGAAIRCYESLGFECCASYLEGIIEPSPAHEV